MVRSAPRPVLSALLALLLFTALNAATAAAVDGPPPQEPPQQPPPQDPPAEPAPAEPATPGVGASEEMIVHGQREIARRRAEINADLLEMGYRAKDKGEVTVYRPDSVWHPSVLVYDDGFVVLKRTPPRFDPPIQGSSNLRYLACVPPFTPMCLRLGGWMVSEKKLTPQKARVADALDADVDAWQAAIIRQANAVRVGQEVPDMLTATWEQGAPLEPGGATLEDPVARRAAILEFWASRADTAEGAAVRAVTGDFIRYVVQDSPWPATPDEIAATEARCGCGASILAEPQAPDEDGSVKP